MRGFANPTSTTCYLSSALQLLLHSPQLVNYLLSDGCATQDLNGRKRNASVLTKEILSLASRYWKEPDDGTPLDVSAVLAALQKHSKTFAKGTYHDAHECFLVVVDALHQGLSKLDRIPNSLARAALDRAHLQAWDESCATGYSFLAEIFQGQMLKNATYEHFWSLSLNLADGDKLTQLLESYCHNAEVTYGPLLLVLHLNRFDAQGNKLEKFVDYGLDLDFAGSRYVLYAVCLHRGCHYTAMCENHARWMHFDDAHCTPTEDPNHIIQRDAYMLCYKKVLTA